MTSTMLQETFIGSWKKPSEKYTEATAGYQLPDNPLAVQFKRNHLDEDSLVLYSLEY